LSTIFKKTECGLAASQMSSQDSTVRLIASRKTTAERSAKRVTFNPYQEVVEVMQEDPGASRPQLTRAVKRRVTTADNKEQLENCRKLVVQGNLSRLFDDQASRTWSQAVWNLLERVMKFTLNAA
jgi:hypothetical protein